MSNQYTPGPWQATHVELDDCFDSWHVVSVADGSYHVIADISAQGSPKEKADNANLISAAPEMLYVLHTAREVFKAQVDPTHSLYARTIDWWRLIEEIEKVLKKTSGLPDLSDRHLEAGILARVVEVLKTLLRDCHIITYPLYRQVHRFYSEQQEGAARERLHYCVTGPKDIRPSARTLLRGHGAADAKALRLFPAIDSGRNQEGAGGSSEPFEVTHYPNVPTLDTRPPGNRFQGTSGQARRREAWRT